MKPTVVALTAVAVLALVWTIFFGAVVAYNAFDDNGMWQAWRGMMSNGHMSWWTRGFGSESTGSASGQGEVVIEDFTFRPSTFNVTPGTVVRWTNRDSAPHTATARDGSFDTGTLNKGESAKTRFDRPGSFDYLCSYHPYMQGKIVVGGTR